MHDQSNIADSTCVAKSLLFIDEHKPNLSLKET